jgi:hypothetical protein
VREDGAPVGWNVFGIELGGGPAGGRLFHRPELVVVLEVVAARGTGRGSNQVSTIVSRQANPRSHSRRL